MCLDETPYCPMRYDEVAHQLKILVVHYCDKGTFTNQKIWSLRDKVHHLVDPEYDDLMNRFQTLIGL